VAKPKVATITLTIEKRGNAQCTRRKPEKLALKKTDAEVIRLTNGNTDGGGVITVFLERSQATKLFNPIPPREAKLGPGESVDWVVADVIGDDGHVNYHTTPEDCTAGDHSDIHMEC
jgi:hypothetical protein